MEALMEGNDATINTTISPVLDGQTQKLSNGYYGETLNMIVNGQPAASSEDIILDDLDAYWDDINARLTVSRMVGNSVIKGIVTAISDEAAQKIAALEAQIAALIDRKNFHKAGSYNFNTATFGLLADESNSDGSLKSSQEHLQTTRLLLENHLDSLERGIQTMKDCSGNFALSFSQLGYEMEENVFMLRKLLTSSTHHAEDICLLFVEHEWKNEFEDDIVATVTRNRCKEFQNMHYDQKICVFPLKEENCNIKMNQLQNIRQELDAIAKTLDSPEIGRLQSQGSYECVEEWTHRKVSRDQSNRENGLGDPDKLRTSESALMEYACLKHMSQDDLISHFHSEINDLKRKHESSLQEVTEEYFRLKRAYMKNTESYRAKKDRMLDTLKKRIPKLVTQMDSIFGDEEHPSSSFCDYEKKHNDCLNALLLENRTLQGRLELEKVETSRLASKISKSSDEAPPSSKASLVREVDQLKDLIDGRELQSCIQQDVCGIFVKELIKEVASAVDLLHVESFYNLDTISLIYKDAMSRNNYIVRTIEEEMKENQKSVLAAESALTEQRKQFDQALQEVEKLKEKISVQEKTIVESSNELEIVRGKFSESADKLDCYKREMDEAFQSLKVAETGLHEADREKARLCNIIQEKESSLSTALSDQDTQREKINAMVILLQDMSKVNLSLGQRMVEVVEEKKTRLDLLTQQIKACVHRVNQLTKRGLLYKQVLERRCSDLKKAENEVDLLADEVDALLNLIEKIYRVLDHYSPLLQQYSGVRVFVNFIEIWKRVSWFMRRRCCSVWCSSLHVICCPSNVDLSFDADNGNSGTY